MLQTYVSSRPTSIHSPSSRAEAVGEAACCVHGTFPPSEEKTTRQTGTLRISISFTASSLPVTGPVGVPKVWYFKDILAASYRCGTLVPSDFGA